jgi:hypothetical protein
LDFNGKIGFVSYFVSFIVPQYVRFFFVRISWSLLIFFCVDLSSWRLLLHWFLFCTCCVSWPPAFSNRPVLLLAPGLDFHLQLLVFVYCAPGRPPILVSRSSFIAAGFPSPRFLSIRSSVSYAGSLSYSRWCLPPRHPSSLYHQDFWLPAAGAT